MWSNQGKQFQATFVVCSDVTWERFYSGSQYKFNRLQDIVQLRGWLKPNITMHDDDTIEPFELEVAVEALAELDYIHLEYAHVEDNREGTGEEVVISKFFPRGL